jgi:hypothetical protein
MIRIVDNENILSQIVKNRRVAVLISVTTSSCKANEIYRELQADEHNISKVLDILSSGNEVTCIASLCNLGINRSIALFSEGERVSKHRYDEVMKCISFSDMLIVVAKNTTVADIISKFLYAACIQGIEVVLLIVH